MFPRRPAGQFPAVSPSPMKSIMGLDVEDAPTGAARQEAPRFPGDHRRSTGADPRDGESPKYHPFRCKRISSIGDSERDASEVGRRSPAHLRCRGGRHC